MHARLLTALVAATLLVAAPGGAAAATQESTFQDDNSLIFNTPQGTANALDQLAKLGVDRLRVSVFWATVAPESQSRTRPQFDAKDPAAYPPGSWDRYDQVVRLAGQRGIRINFNVTSPAPLWATNPSPPREDIGQTFEPSPAELEQFVHALGVRYSGTYQATTATSTAPQSPNPFCTLLQSCPAPEPTPVGEVLPRVDYYTIWNEPNQPGWLTPQWVEGAQGGWVAAAPRLYRGLADGMYAGLVSSGHGDDTILVGETAPKGLLRPGTTAAVKALQFVRELYCVGEDLKPFTGDAARVRACPEAADPAGFAAAHPVLFKATGYAHHPYSLFTSPRARPTDDDFITLANLSRLKRTLASVFTTYGQPGPPPLYLTEFGYNTTPPNPAGVSLSGQARYLNESEFIARTDPDVRTFSQFLLVDDAQRTPGTVGYGVTFQTGLTFINGRRKPSYDAYRLSVHLPRTTVTAGRTLRVWGLVRPASLIGSPQRVRIQQRAGGRLRTLRTVTTRADGVLDLRVRIPRSGSIRLAWTDPRDRKTVFSRSVAVSAKARRSTRR